MSAARFALVTVTVCVAACGGGADGNQSRSPTAPTGAGGTARTEGAWTGTITRPGGAPPIAVRWEATRNPSIGYQLAGPMTLTNGGTSITITAIANTAGNDSSGYRIHMQLTSNAGEIAGFPTCSVRGNTAGSPGEDPFPEPFTRISVAALDLSFNACRGFIEYPSPTQNFIQETVQLTMTK